MHAQTLVKLPFRLARAVYRAVRDELRAAARGGPSPAAPAQPAPAAPPTPSAAPPPEAPPPAPARPPVTVRVEETPNPDALKFVCSTTVVPQGSVALNDRANAAGIPFAQAIFDLDGVRTVFATKDFVTVTRLPDGPGWEALRPAIVAALERTVAG